MKKTPLAKNVDEYIAGMPKEIRHTLDKLRQIIKKAAPKAHERISYGMPFYEYRGTGFKGRLVYFSVSKKYIAVYFAPTRAGKSLDRLKRYQVTKSSFHFSLDEAFPFQLIGDTVREIIDKAN
jgi:uncharacterized protein YdhG (YjbR/CyaY superfamily)